jgi:hypothetical protein
MTQRSDSASASERGMRLAGVYHSVPRDDARAAIDSSAAHAATDWSMSLQRLRPDRCGRLGWR